MIYFVSGTGTGVGKTVVTGLAARDLARRGVDAITVKMVQTGDAGFSEDVEEHRRLAGGGPFPEDAAGLTAPQVFAFPSSPELSARLEGKNQMASAMLNGLKKIEFYQAAVGLGYGYNYTPNQGRLLMHISAAPLLVFFNKNFITAAVDVPLSDGSRFQTDISKEVKTKHKYFLTGVARASVHYNLSKQVYVGAAALVNDIHFSSASGVEIQMDDWIVNASVGVRF